MRWLASCFPVALAPQVRYTMDVWRSALLSFAVCFAGCLPSPASVGKIHCRNQDDCSGARQCVEGRCSAGGSAIDAEPPETPPLTPDAITATLPPGCGERSPWRSAVVTGGKIDSAALAVDPSGGLHAVWVTDIDDLVYVRFRALEHFPKGNAVSPLRVRRISGAVRRASNVVATADSFHVAFISETGVLRHAETGLAGDPIWNITDIQQVEFSYSDLSAHATLALSPSGSVHIAYYSDDVPPYPVAAKYALRLVSGEFVRIHLGM